MNKPEFQRLSYTKNIPKPTEYVLALDGECRDWAYNEERALEFKGQWREKAFSAPDKPLDLEIGTGNGIFFAHQAEQHPERSLIGIEIKYKPLIQSIRRALRAKCENARIMRYNAKFPEDLFAEKEIDNIYIHCPDPWTKKTKNRLLQISFLKKLIKLQKAGGLLEFKTDSRDYFDQAVDAFRKSEYEFEFLTYDLHNSEIKDQAFKTHFEQIFIKQGLPIHYALLKKPTATH